jgi:hypothetical protein
LLTRDCLRQLTIELLDGEFIGGRETKSEAIGSTTIDLEDRWFCQDWKDEKYKPREVCGLRGWGLELGVRAWGVGLGVRAWGVGSRV